MRLNKFVAAATGLSRRKADELIEAGKITVNGERASHGIRVNPGDEVRHGNSIIKLPAITTIAFHKPRGYVCSRKGQGSKTIYDLLPPGELHSLKPVGRLDKDSSGLLLMTNDGTLANNLTHPRHRKIKVYEIEVDRPVQKQDFKKITQTGIKLDDGVSKLKLEYLEGKVTKLKVLMSEGRNRQIRRTFQALNYKIINLHRIKFGDFSLGALKPATWHKIETTREKKDV